MTTAVQSAITISKAALNQVGGVVILSFAEYQRLKTQQSVPTYYLKNKAARDLDALVEQGLKEYKQGKTKPLSYLDEI